MADPAPSPDPPPEAMLRLLRERAVVRRYTAEPVGDELLAQLLDVTVAAPTASNKQGWAFVAVRDPRVVRRLRGFSPGMIGVPPLVVVACFDRERSVGDASEPWDLGMLCVAMAVENLLLAAHVAGLGACPASSFHTAAVRRLLDLPEHLVPLLLVAVGHPARQPEQTRRRPREEVIRYESWGS